MAIVAPSLLAADFLKLNDECKMLNESENIRGNPGLIPRPISRCRLIRSLPRLNGFERCEAAYRC